MKFWLCYNCGSSVMNLKESMFSLSIFMTLRSIYAFIKCREKNWELGRQRHESKSLFEMDGWGGYFSKTIRPGHKLFPFLLCPFLVLLPLDSFLFLSIFLQEKTFSKCSSDKCQKYSWSVAFLLLQKTQCEEVAQRMLSLFNYSMHSNSWPGIERQ